jgi:hypothetical protein
MEPSLEQRIRERAYEIWNATGRGDGRADEHWLSAERELLATRECNPLLRKRTAARKSRRPTNPRGAARV